MCIRDRLGRNQALTGSHNQRMPLQIVFGVAFHSPATIEVAPVHSSKVGGVIDNDRPLTFEKLINIKVSLGINVIA